jgi:hypothetical protein
VRMLAAVFLLEIQVCIPYTGTLTQFCGVNILECVREKYAYTVIAEIRVEFRMRPYHTR